MRTPDRFGNPPDRGEDPRQFDNRSGGDQAVEERPLDDRGYEYRGEAAARAPAPVSAESMSAARVRQREAFGGFDIGSAAFGWLVAIGLGVLLTSIATAAGAAFGLVEEVNQPTITASSTIGTVGAIVITLIGFASYFAGGYVAGRMARFDGVMQGLGVWGLGLVMTAIAAITVAIFGSEYNVFARLNLPRIPIDEGTLATAGGITLFAIAAATLIGAATGGMAGERFHRRVDRAGTEDDRRAPIRSA